MGLRGPKPKLAIQDYLDGSPHHGAKSEGKVYTDDSPKALGSIFVPDHLPEDAQGVIEVIRESMPPGVYAKLDTFLLSAFAVAWMIHRKATMEISAPEFEWLEENTETGLSKPNPWITVQRNQAMLMATLGDRLGLDPKARQSLKLPGQGKKRSKFEGLIGGHRQGARGTTVPPRPGATTEPDKMN